MFRSKLKYVTDGQNQPTVDLAANNVNGVANGVNGAANGKQQYAFKDSGNDHFNVNPSSADGTQGELDSNPVGVQAWRLTFPRVIVDVRQGSRQVHL